MQVAIHPKEHKYVRYLLQNQALGAVFCKIFLFCAHPSQLGVMNLLVNQTVLSKYGHYLFHG